VLITTSVLLEDKSSELHTVLWLDSICISVLDKDVFPNEMLDFAVDLLELIMLVDGGTLEKMGRGEDVLYT
jgi:hypothetical protein